jgi:hypothetical protein
MKIFIPSLLASTILAVTQSLHAQGTAFTYQGRLNSSGSPTSGLYDFRFRLDADPAGNTILGTVLTNAIPVTNGLFTTTIDFGPGWFNGSNYWLEVDVRTNTGGNGNYTVLNPFQPLTPTPYAIFASTASNVSGVISAAQLSGPVASANLSGTYGNAVTLNNPGNSFTGNGANVSNVNATALGGLAAGNFWQLGGNNVSPGQIIGSTNNQPLEFRAGGQRVLLLSPSATDAPNILGGAPVNMVDPGVQGAVIAGGGTTNFLGSSSSNRVSANFGSIGGGSGNWIQSGSDHSGIGGGWQNLIASNSYESVIAGGQNNTMSSTWSFIGGGIGNTNSGQLATIGGGADNTGSGVAAFIGGGQNNNASGQFATIGGGLSNTNLGYRSAIGGGENNNIQTPADRSTISGGGNNVIVGSVSYSVYSTIGGGAFNTIPTNSIYSTISGGYQNTAGGGSSTVGGGQNNTNNGTIGTIAGGGYNTIAASALYATIGGGLDNTNSGNLGGTIAGGLNNTTSGQSESTVGGGFGNTVTASFGTVGGGQYNTNNGQFGTIAGGGNNTVAAFTYYATVGGGQNNTSGGLETAISGGYSNVANGAYATIPGGFLNVANGVTSFAAGQSAQALHQGAFVWADSQGTPFSSTANDQFLVRSQGGVGINMNNPNGASLYVAGNRTNSWPNSMSFFENTGTGTNDSPALRVFADGSAPAGALSVSTEGSGLIAQFGNGVAFVSQLDVNGNWTAASFSGNGGGLTSLSAANLSGPVPSASLTSVPAASLTGAGTLPAAVLPASVITNTETGVILSGAFSGNGGGLTNLSVNAAQLTGGANNNIFVGPAGNATTGGFNNTASGFQALFNNTTGSGNTAGGSIALESNTVGSFNTASGFQALLSNTNGAHNTANGYGALFKNIGGSFNTALGDEALDVLAGGTNNIALGYLAGNNFNANESSNIDIGNPGVTGENNTIRIGSSQTQAYIAGVINGNGGGLSNLDASQLTSGTIPPARLPAGVLTNNENGAVTLNGVLDLPATSVTVNSGGALFLHSDGNQNFFAGPSAGNIAGTGGNNTAIGYAALFNNQTGAGNTALGYQAFENNLSGNNNVAVGYQTLLTSQRGNNNLAIGYQAGSALTTGSSNIYVGNPGNPTENNTIRIGTPGTQANTYIAGSVNVGLGGANLRLNDQPVYFRAGSDTNHGLAYCGPGVTNFAPTVLPDGPVLWGFTGGVLGAMNGGPHAMVSWTATGVGISNASPGHLLVVGSSGSPAFCDGTTWQNGSDRNAKENFAPINPRAVLEKVSALPITEWKYKVEGDGTEHLGPMAQDFHAAFGLNGADDRHIATVDEEGVALAAIQGLNQKLNEKDARIQEQGDEIAELKSRLEKLEQLMNGKNGGTK